MNEEEKRERERERETEIERTGVKSELFFLFLSRARAHARAQEEEKARSRNGKNRNLTGLADVDQVQDVLLETRPPKAHGRGQELGPDARVRAHTLADLLDVGARRLAQSRDGVHRRDALRQHRVGRQLRQLCRPEIGAQHALGRDPALVDRGQPLDGGAAVLVVAPADQDPVRLGQVLHRRALREELRVGQDVEAHARVAVVAREHLLDGLGGAHGHGRLLDDDLGGLRNGRDHARGALPVRQVGRPAGAHAARLRGRVDRHEHDVCLAHVLVRVGREEQVSAAAGLHYLLEPRLVDRERVRVPGVDAGLVDVDDDDSDVGALEGDHGHRGALGVCFWCRGELEWKME